MDGDKATCGVEVGEDTIISAVSTLPDEPSIEVLCSMPLDAECPDVSTYATIGHEESDVDTMTYHSADFGTDHLQLKNLLHLLGQLKVDDNMIATAIKHFDVPCQMLAAYSQSNSMTNEHNDRGFSLVEFHALEETIGIVMHNYLLHRFSY